MYNCPKFHHCGLCVPDFIEGGKHFILDYFFIDWEDLFKIDELNADNSTKMYLDKINILLDTYAPLKRINKTS